MQGKTWYEEEWGFYTGSPAVSPNSRVPNENTDMDFSNKIVQDDDLVQFILSDTFGTSAEYATPTFQQNPNTTFQQNPNLFQQAQPSISNIGFSKPLKSMQHVKSMPNFNSQTQPSFQNAVGPLNPSWGPRELSDFSANFKPSIKPAPAIKFEQPGGFVPGGVYQLDPYNVSNFYAKPNISQTAPTTFNLAHPKNPGFFQFRTAEITPRGFGSFPNLNALAQVIGSPTTKLPDGPILLGQQPQKNPVLNRSNILQDLAQKSLDQGPPQSQRKNSADVVDEKKARRLAKNRESARASRVKNKQYLESLENSNMELFLQMNAARWKYLDSCAQNIRRRRREESSQMCARMRQRLVSNVQLNPQEERVYSSALSAIHKKYGHFSDEHKALVDFEHLELGSKLFPAYQRFLLWLTGQPDQFFDRLEGKHVDNFKWTTSNKFIGDKLFSNGQTTAGTEYGGGMWQLLCHEVGISLEQEEKLGSIRRSVRENANFFPERNKICHHQDATPLLQNVMNCTAFGVHSRHSQFQSVLTPQQVFDYTDWVEENKPTIRSHTQKKHFDEYIDGLLSESFVDFVEVLKKPTQELCLEELVGLLSDIPFPSSYKHEHQNNL